MNVNINFEYTEMVVPKRCRKLRPMAFQGEYTTEIREVTAEQAPVAIIERDNHCVFKKGIVVEYRWFDNQLYTRFDLTSWDRDGNNPRYKYNTPDTEGYNYSYWKGCLNLEKRIADIKEWSEQFLYIDGVLYLKHGEPRYVVMTYGLGCNHGGTSLSVDYYYNPNISHTAYFPLTKREEAIKSAKKTALNRGDDKSVPIKLYHKFEILIPEAIQVNPEIQHGDGDPFINQMEFVISSCKDPLIAGGVILGTVAHLV